MSAQRISVALVVLAALSACGDDTRSRGDCERDIVAALDAGRTYADGWRLHGGCDDYEILLPPELLP